MALDLAIGVAGRAWAVDELAVGELAVSARVAVAAVSARGWAGALGIWALNLAGLARLKPRDCDLAMVALPAFLFPNALGDVAVAVAVAVAVEGDS